MRHFFRQCRMPIFLLTLNMSLSALAQEKTLQVNGVVTGDKPFLFIGSKYFRVEDDRKNKDRKKNNEIPGLGILKEIDQKKRYIVVEDKNGRLQKIRIAIVSGETLSNSGQRDQSGGEHEEYSNEGYFPDMSGSGSESPVWSHESRSAPPFVSDPSSHDEPLQDDQPPSDSPPLPPGGIPAGAITDSDATTAAKTVTSPASHEVNTGLVFSKSQLFAVSANSGPLWGDHLLAIEVRDLPADKKVEILLGNKLCKGLRVLSKNNLICRTPPMDRDEQVELALKIAGEVVDTLSYRYQNSEEINEIRAVSGIPNRTYETAVFANGKIYFWGGVDKKSQGIANGVIYDTQRDTWSIMETANQPTPAMGAVSVFTGQDIIVWGGRTKGGYTNQGGIYNIRKKQWRKLPSLDSEMIPSPRAFATAVWTGTQMIVWGGEAKLGQRLNSGAIYDVQTQTWTAISSPQSFVGRSHHFAYWDGTEMKVWGGYQAGVVAAPGIIGAYKPETNQWRRISTSLSSPRVFHRDLGWAWFTGSKLMLQGPKNSPDLGNLRWPIYYDNEIERWPVDQSPLPALRSFPDVPNKQGQRPTAVWSGRYLFVFTDGANGFRYSFP